jgi:predicted phage terminase large subunit-like protein
MKITPELIEGFFVSLLKADLEEVSDTPECHREWWAMCCSDRKFVALAAPRGHAKSTAITYIYVLASILFRERRFVVLVSDTEEQSKLFLGSIWQTIQQNDDLRALFGVEGFDKESATDLIIRFVDGHTCKILAKGSQQKLRGMTWGKQKLRPDLIIGDDMENDEIVLNKERRAAFKRWFLSALLPTLAKNGVIRLVGTILHMDSLLENFMPQAWRTADRAVVTELKIVSYNVGSWYSAKYRAHPAMDDFSEVLWPSFKPAAWLKNEQQVYKLNGEGDLWAQEMLNEPLDESNTLFQKGDFLPIKPADLEKPVNFYVTMDLATTKDNVKRDYSVFQITAVDEELRSQVRHVIKQRMDSVEICDTILLLQKTYEPLMFVVEKGSITNSILPFLRLKMMEENVWPIIHMIANRVDKVQHSASIRGRMRAGFVKFDKDADWYPGYEQECIRFPRDRHDDQVDSLSLLGDVLNKLIASPTKEDIAEMEYQQRKEDAEELGDDGRSQWTGY